MTKLAIRQMNESDDHLPQARHSERGERSYWLHLPKGYDSQTPAPLVLAFHGGASNGRALRASSGLNDKADAAGFIVAYPNGTGPEEKLLYWNAGHCCGPALEHRSDDMAFVGAILDDLAAHFAIDPRRVFATGLSNGAMLSYRLAAECSERFAAIAPVAGPMAAPTKSRRRQPVSIVHFHGTADLFTPFDGGVGKRSVTKTSHASIPHTIEAWVRANGCPPQPAIAELPPTIDDGMRIVEHSYGPGRDGAEVVLYVVEGGGHTWPGRPANTFVFGKSTQNLSANDVMWDFFCRHPMPM